MDTMILFIFFNYSISSFTKSLIMFLNMVKLGPDYDDSVGILPDFYDVNLGIFMMSNVTVTLIL